MGFGNVGKIWTPALLREHVKAITPNARWRGVTLHHTGSPSLAQRPEGLKIQHLINIRDFYRDVRQWSSGPHFFTDEDQIFGLCPLNEVGVHAPGFNRHYLGIEALGDYMVEDPKSGRGLAVWRTTAQAAAILLQWLKLPADDATIKIHREDPLSNTACPGDKTKKPWLLAMINDYLTEGLEEVRPERWSVILNRRAGKRWTQVQIFGHALYVPVFAFLKEHGVPGQQIVSTLRRESGKFFYGADELEHAFADEQGTTWAPLRETAAVMRLPVAVSTARVVTVG